MADWQKKDSKERLKEREREISMNREEDDNEESNGRENRERIQ